MTDNEPLDLLADYVAPDNELLDRVLARIGSPQHRRVFYSKLENPKWVKPLADTGAFDSVPPVVVDGNGATRFAKWPEGEYLARAAALVPGEVVSVLLPLADTDNVVVQSAVVNAASRMPAGEATKLLAIIISYLNKPYREWLDPGRFVDLIQLLGNGGEAERALLLARALYMPRPQAESMTRTTWNIAGGLSEYWYAQTLPAVASALAAHPAMLASLVIWLRTWVDLSPHSRFQRSSFWRESIEAGTQDTRTEPVGHALVDAVRDVARAQIDAERPLLDVVGSIEAGNAAIFSRLALDAITHAVRGPLALGADLSGDISAGSDGAPAVVAYERLMTAPLLAAEYRHEYALLARILAPSLPATRLSEWSQMIVAPPHLDAQQLRNIVGNWKGEAEEITDGDIARYLALWQRDLLLDIGRDALPGYLRDRLDELVTLHGEPHSQNLLQSRGGFFVGPTSPLSDAQIAQLSPEGLLTYLRSWEPAQARALSPGFGFPPSIEGLARSLTTAVLGKPSIFAEYADQFIGLRSAYVRAVLEGFEQAIRRGNRVSWEPLLQLVVYAAMQQDDGSEATGDFGDAEAWRFAQQQAARLVQAGMDSQPALAIPPSLYQLAWLALGSLVLSPHPTPEDEQKYGPPSTDALTLSLNTTRPVALRAAIRLLTAASRRQADADPDVAASAAQTIERILAALDHHVGPSADPSVAVAAVFGESVGMLLTAAPEWTSQRLERILGAPDGQSSLPPHHQVWYETAWAVLLSGYRPSRGLLTPLKPWFMQGIRNLSVKRPATSATFSTRSPRQALADHVLILYVTGQLDGGLEDEVVTALFRYGDGESLGDALGHLGWELRHAQGEIAMTVLERFQALWDWRAEQVAAGRADRGELSGFYWWVSSGRFAPDWWLPRLAFVLEDPQFDGHATLGEALAHAAENHPRLVLQVFTALHARSVLSGLSFDLVEHMPLILKAALLCDEEDVRRSARDLMQELGNENYTDLMERIRAIPE